MKGMHQAAAVTGRRQMQWPLQMTCLRQCQGGVCKMLDKAIPVEHQTIQPLVKCRQVRVRETGAGLSLVSASLLLPHQAHDRGSPIHIAAQLFYQGLLKHQHRVNRASDPISAARCQYYTCAVRTTQSSIHSFCPAGIRHARSQAEGNSTSSIISSLIGADSRLKLT